ncbi:DUF6480 family protein [Nocardia jinanensis]|uniref:Uncharacterized protein n=1 Tax=Nocardia jinanensis TaxID=382504 RepID=A0A917VYF7_9NOCA|nr:DUF6480 family protein [Nocardia jinanensis]GGL45430.1 hypothetical protein GCM10011588_70190 [Nocardia jinanensis]
MSSMDPDPDRTPGLEPGGGVSPGSTPPDTAQTSGLSADEPATRYRFPRTGVVAVVLTIALVVVFLAVAVGLVAMIVG